jgi:hypothetical protein
LSVLPEKYLELIHAEIDGEASEKELATLREYLASDTNAQKVRAELAKLTDILGQIEGAETPSDLHTSILAALPTRPIMETVGPNNSPWRLRTPFIRYGYALAAGLILGAALTGVAFRDLSPIEKSDVYGTMAARENTSNYIAVDKMKLTAHDLGGSVELRRSGDNEMIVFDLNGEQAVEVEVKFDGSQTGLKGFSQQPNSIRSFEAKEGSISFLSEGNQRSTIMLATHKHPQLPLSLSFYVGGKLVHQGSLGSLAPGGSTK